MKLTLAQKIRLKKKYGPWAIVTGASMGIGRELAERLAEAGLHLVLVSRRKASLEDLSSTWAHQYHITIRIISADLSTSEDLNRMIDSTTDLSIGLLVASAGFGTSGLFLHAKLEEEINMLRVNCEALLILTHYFGKSFFKTKARRYHFDEFDGSLSGGSLRVALRGHQSICTNIS